MSAQIATLTENPLSAKEANILWFLPIAGDGRYLGTDVGAREVNFRYLKQIAQAADDLGYYGVLIPTGRSCEDPFVIASAVSAVTERLRTLVALRPGGLSPTVVARMAATLDRVSNGRLLINVVAGGDPVESRGDGVFLSHDERYEATAEFLHIWTRLLAGETVSYQGRYYAVEDARQIFPPVQRPHPPLFFGGSSAVAHDLAASAIDKYLTWGEPPAAVAAKIADLRARAAVKGRRISFGVRLQVIVRETNEEAWAAANALIRHLDDDTIAAAQRTFARMDSEGQARVTALHSGKRDKLEISPNLWAGIGLVRGGAGTALVGDPETVAERLKEYMALGVDTFVLSGYPHLEEAYRFAELVFPLLPLAAETGRPRGFATNHGPFGERVDRRVENIRQASQS